jgi:hypothetical protein
MKSHGAKVGLLLTAVLIALGGVGVGLAAWTSSVYVEADVTTGEVGWRIIDATCDSIVTPQELCEDTAWALCDWDDASGRQGVNCGGWCFDCPHNWGQYFEYTIGDSLVLPLVAGQHTQIGTVTVETEDGDIIVEYEITAADWAFDKSHLYVKKSEPTKCSPGLFPYSSEEDGSVVVSSTVHRYAIPVRSICRTWCGHVYIAAHADVVQPCGTVSDVASAGRYCPPVPTPTPCPTPTPTPCPTPEPTVTPAEVCDCEATAQDKMVVVHLPGSLEGCAGEVTFHVLNTGTIPIKVDNVIIAAPPGVETTLLTPGIIGMQIDPGKTGFGSVSFEVTAPGDYTFTVTVHTVVWNLY